MATPRPPQEQHLSTISGRIEAVERAIDKISDSMVLLARLEERHGETREALKRAFDLAEKHDTRLCGVERELAHMPLLRALVWAVVMGALGAIGSLLWHKLSL
jgi:hypothetical protein